MNSSRFQLVVVATLVVLLASLPLYGQGSAILSPKDVLSSMTPTFVFKDGQASEVC